MHFTNNLFNLINGMAGQYSYLDNVMIIISKCGPYVLMLISIMVYMRATIKKDRETRGVIVDTIFSTGLAIVFSQILGHMFYFARPFENSSFTKTLYYHEPNSSFPSDHSIGCMGLALGLQKQKSKFNKLYVILAILVGFSRVYVGHHYPLDVIGGFLLAYIFNKIYHKFIKTYVRKIYFYIEENTPVLRNIY